MTDPTRPRYRIVDLTIAAPADRVAAFARDPRNLPRWAAGLAAGVRNDGTGWIGESPMGPVRIAFAPDNPFGVLDHDVTLPDGRTLRNVMRVTPTEDGCLLTFVVQRLPEHDDAAFDADCTQVAADLAALARLLE